MSGFTLLYVHSIDSHCCWWPWVPFGGHLTFKAKFYYAIWSQTGPKLVTDLSQTC